MQPSDTVTDTDAAAIWSRLDIHSFECHMHTCTKVMMMI